MTTEKLAILGGAKTINKKAPHYSWPIITKTIKDSVVKQLSESISIYNKSGIIEKFENYFANYHDVKHAVLCNSGTTAIYSMFIAARFKEGDEIICPAYTFFASVTPLLFTGAKPVLCDCDDNGNIDPAEILKKITPKTKGVVVTHMWGVPCQMDKIVSLCRKNNLLLLEDCSHAHGAKFKGKKVGSFGDLSAWSLQGPKIISGGEGGIVTTNNKEFYYRILLLGHYNKRCKDEINKEHNLYKYSTTGMGLKFRSHPVAVRIAYSMLSNLDTILRVKRMFAKKIIKEFKKIPYFALPPAFSDPAYEPAWYGLVFQYKGYNYKYPSIDNFFRAIQAEGLLEVDRPGSTSPLNLLPLFQNPTELFPIYKKNYFSYKPGDFPKAEKFYKYAIKLPVWALKKEHKMVDYYIKGFKKVCNNLDKII
ncbi:DegT/DnrJ/EryC1/StrS family aminotransferase [Candidatus Kuenenbacteria bacterium]|nr:DegT/DnrJ/EryC1/StrS family aminotransferase [Candidatus Kuenenbacteria bacterium]